ncbi:hypothetical protein FNV43_RR22427 [Rhamnella rubrinervis]|uniref:DUF761 domain-containing protein n=1 Tax=Rhamnella rubrinervis TaxID=2594499 RepID=A0A8K0GV69_9ROSA|nr:hypothetical protein FNV43_RR22427 [Rhamnella rubrinervis]
MKNRVSRIVKQIIAALGSIAKAKSMALKSKTTALKTRIVIFSLLRDKKIMMSSISHKLQALVGHHHHHEKKHSDHGEQQLVDDDHDRSNTLVMHTNKVVACSEPQLIPNPTQTTSTVDDDGHADVGYLKYENEDENKYPDLTHSLFELEDMKSIEEEDPRASVIDMVKNSKEEAGEEFKLEDEIDNMADIFIKRFYQQMVFQKQQSLKRYQEMLLKTA